MILVFCLRKDYTEDTEMLDFLLTGMEFSSNSPRVILCPGADPETFERGGRGPEGCF